MFSGKKLVKRPEIYVACSKMGVMRYEFPLDSELLKKTVEEVLVSKASKVSDEIDKETAKVYVYLQKNSRGGLAAKNDEIKSKGEKSSCASIKGKKLNDFLKSDCKISPDELTVEDRVCFYFE